MAAAALLSLSCVCYDRHCDSGWLADASLSAGWVPNSFSVPADFLFAAVCVLGYWLLRGGANWRRGCVLDHMIIE